MFMLSREETGARTAYPAPVVARWGGQPLELGGPENPSTPLIVLLHGRGSSENSMIELAPHLPFGPAYAAVRGPLEDGTGFTWFAGHGAGRPEAASLATSMDWFMEWLDAEGDPERPAILVGFSAGAALAAALMLSRPERWAGGVLLYGALPFDAGVPLTRGRLAGMPVLLAHGEEDTVVPAELQQLTWDYLVQESGAPLQATRVPGGHQLAGATVGDVGRWLGERLSFINRYGENPVPDGEDQPWPWLAGGRLAERAGEPPQISVVAPQQQESQHAPAALQEALHARLTALPGVREVASTEPGRQALVLDRAEAAGPDEAFVVPGTGEFAHLHAGNAGSLHVALPAALAYDALAKGWAVAHPQAGVGRTPGLVMVFGPRDADELDVVTGIVTAAHTHARTPL
jgi:phospholipase/carboxylesterase